MVRWACKILCYSGVLLDASTLPQQDHQNILIYTTTSFPSLHEDWNFLVYPSLMQGLTLFGSHSPSRFIFVGSYDPWDGTTPDLRAACRRLCLRTVSIFHIIHFLPS
ncbi:hypothetical protein BD769DRAFT_1441278 [Suillus cothurnatus]|nr:hypothetical protein BD769DRAFT_1441278 [Suillus cothurnatus]